jgi:hypothetical protein
VHEAGIARAIAAELRERGLAVGEVRLLVEGGHDAPDAFDASLRAHLALEMPGVDVIRILHLPSLRLCAGCGRAFESVTAEDPCPVCGGSSLPEPVRNERVRLEID